MKRAGPWLEWAALACIVLLYGAFLRAELVPYPLGYDAQAYHLGARLLAEEGRYHQQPADPYVLVGPHWVETGDGVAYPKYPPMYPALVAAAIRAFGPGAGMLVNPLCALLALVGVYLLCRGFLSRRMALLGPLLLALNPVLAAWSLEGVSHASSVCFLVWGYAAFLHARRLGGRRAWILLAVAGLLVGYAVGIRYTNILLVIPPALALFVWPAEETPGPPRLIRLAVYGAGLLVPCGALALYHWQAFGGPLTTAYAFSHEQTAFSLSYLASNAGYYVTGMVATAFGPILLLAALGLTTTLVDDWRRGLFFAAWILPLTLLYMAYWFGPEQAPGLFMQPELLFRFLLPVVVPCIVLGVWFLHRAAEAISPETRKQAGTRELTKIRELTWLVATLVLVQGVWGAVRTHEVVVRRGVIRRVAHGLVGLVERHVPEGSTIFTEYPLGLHLSYSGAYAVYPDVLLNRRLLRKTMEPLQEGGDFPGIHLRRHRRLKRLLVEADGWTYLRRIRALIAGPLEQGRRVYLVIRRKELRRLNRLYGRHATLEVVKRSGDHVIARIIAVR